MSERNEALINKFDQARRTVTEYLSSRDDEFQTGLKASVAVCDLLDEMEAVVIATLDTLTSVFETQSANTESVRMLAAWLKEFKKTSAGDKQQIAELEGKLIALIEERFN